MIGAPRVAPASMAQRMLWMLDRHQAGTGCLNYPLLLELRGRLDRRALSATLDGVVARHEALRTTYERRAGRLVQLIHPPTPVPITDGGAFSDAALETSIGTPIDARRTTVRATVWTTGPDACLLCVDAHHLNTDAWSARVVAEEIAAGLAGTAPPRVTWQFRHALEWQRRRGPGDDEARAYWSARLAGARPLPIGPGTGAPASPVTRDLGTAGAATLNRLAREHRTTTFTVLFAAVAAALATEYGLDDVCVASPFANRAHPDAMRTVGMFANLVVLRVPVPDPADLAALIRASAQAVGEARPYQHFPYAVLPEAAHGLARLEDAVVQLLPPLSPPVVCGPVRMRVLPPRLAARFPLEITVIADGETLHGRLQHDPERVGADRSARIAAAVRAVVSPNAPAATPAPA